MNAEQLHAHYDRIAEAPDAIPRLRRFIIDLAVRGKLAPQDPNDEPVLKLLRRIAAEKARLVKAGEIKKPKLSAKATGEKKPFLLPISWAWARVGELFIYDAGTKRDPQQLENARWLLELEDIEKGTSRILSRLKVRDRQPRSTKSEFKIGDILYGKLRPYLTKVLVADAPGYSTTEIVAIRPILPLCSNYCALAFRRSDFVDYVTRLGRGTKMPRLRTDDAISSFFPLPPLAEQKRIVAKVDELMTLCDRLEAARNKREVTRDRLAAASLARLKRPDPDEQSFRNHATQTLEILTPLTARPDQIKNHRQTILNLAARGKLVSQDPNDEPALALLKRMAIERRSYLSRGRKQRIRECEIRGSKEPFPLPSTWIWTCLGELVLEMRYGTAKKCGYEYKGVPVLRIPNVSGGEVSLEDLKYGSLSDKEIEELSLRRGDLLVIRSNGSLRLVGRAAEVGTAAEGMAFAGYLVRVRLSARNLLSRFIWVAMNTDHVRDQIEKPIRSAVGLKNVNLTEFAALTIPLPPLAEQHRIVAKVDELMVLCSRLETQLATAQRARGQLLEAVIHEALASAA